MYAQVHRLAQNNVWVYGVRWPAYIALLLQAKRGGEISIQEHETIMEEAERRDRLEYNDNDGSEEDKGKDSDNKEDECESNLELEGVNQCQLLKHLDSYQNCWQPS